MRTNIIIGLTCVIAIFILLICLLEKFENPKPTVDLKYLRLNTRQLLINPLNENIFPKGFVPSGSCLYPEQCPNAQKGLWGGAASS
jgi:hypothetical protein